MKSSNCECALGFFMFGLQVPFLDRFLFRPIRGQYLVTSLSLSIFELQKSYLHENWSEFNQKCIGGLRPSLGCLLSKLRAISTNQRLSFCLKGGGGGVKGQNWNFHSSQPLHFEDFELRMCAWFFHFWPPSAISWQISIWTNERPVFGHKSISVIFWATEKLFTWKLVRPSLVCLVSKLRAISTNQRLAFCIWL